MAVELNFFSNARIALFSRVLKILLKNKIDIKSVIDIDSTDLLLCENNKLEDIANFLSNFISGNFELNIKNLDLKYSYNAIQNSISANALWCAMGASYAPIDINGNDNSLAFDLNENFKTTYNFNEQFDVVASINGTLEHVFDQNACFENIHNLCKVGGVIALQVTADGDIDHGLFSYQPNFFTALSRANGYDILDLNINIMNKKNNSIDFYNYKSDEYKKVFNDKGFKLNSDEYLHIGFVAKKLKDNKFEKPLQESYIKYIKDKQTAKKYICLYNNLLAGQDVCIFGTKEAAKIAYDKAKYLDFNIKYFVDDFASGEKEGLQIIGWNEFIKLNLPLFVGPDQKGITKQRGQECKIIEVVK